MLLTLGICATAGLQASASSHREAPLIAYDPQGDNTDVYAFKSPTDSNKIIIICDFIPFQLPQGGPNYYQFGQNIRYEIHIKNKTTTTTDDITYRFTFQTVNEDTTTFFNIRLGKQNLKNTYLCERSMDGGNTFSQIVQNGEVPPNNIGPRSIDGSLVGLGVGNYDSLMRRAVRTAGTGERVFAGPIDDPFFVDLGGIFDLGGIRNPGRDGLAKYNVHTIALEVPINILQGSGMPLSAATSILDPNYVIGVWASTSRQQITTLNANGTQPTPSGNWVQISRLGMPLTNEAVIPIGSKDKWNSLSPLNNNDLQFASYFKNPELALYMASGTATNGTVTTTYYGAAVPGLFDSLKIQSASMPSTSLPAFDFRNGQKGLWPLKGNPALVGTALDPATYGNILIPDSTSPRAADILPIFLTGVPNLRPYQLLIGKSTNGNINPLAPGKPFINNFLPVIGDMLRLNMAVPATPRNSPNFSSEGLLAAAVIAFTNPGTYGNTTLQNIPNMDGFPNGRRLEDDVTRIELQAVGGLVLAAVGLPFNDYVPSSTANPLTPRLLSEVGFSAGPQANDTTFKAAFPFVQQPWRGFNGSNYVGPTAIHDLGIAAPLAVMNAYPNPFTASVSFRYKIASNANVQINVVDINGRLVQSIQEGHKAAGEYTSQWTGAGNLATGSYFAQLMIGGNVTQTVKLVKIN